MTDHNETLIAALDLAGRGYAVFPCHRIEADGSCSCGDRSCRNAGKHPWTADGFKSASTDQSAVGRMFRGPRSSANIGLATGPVSGFWVLDVEAAGLPILAQWEQQHGALPQTVTSITGGGGRHYAFKWNGVHVKNRSKINGAPVDTRGDGGYIVVPPSNHKSGESYRWERSPDTPLAVAPDWLVALVTTKTKTPAATGTSTTVERLARHPGATEGNRHSTALELIGREIGIGTPQIEVNRLAQEWASRCSPPMDQDQISRIVGDLADKHVQPEKSFSDHVRQIHQAATARTAGPQAAPPTPWTPFPTEALPEPIRSYTIETAAAIGCDPAFTCTAILPCLAGSVGITRAIRLNDRWNEPCVLWAGIVGPSGSHKSPAIDEATRHVKRRQAEQFEDFAQDQAEHAAAVERYKVELAEWKRDGKKKDERAPAEPIEPSCKRSYVSDATIEALAAVLAENQRGTILVRDELSAWFNSQGEYKKGPGSDREKWLSIFGARDLLSDRKTGDKRTIYIKRAAVSIVGGVQPETLQRVFTSEAFETGLAARWLLCCPPRRARRWNDVRVDWSLDQQVETVFDHLYRLRPNGLENHHDPVVLDLAPAAKDAWIEFYNRHGDRITNSDGIEAALLSKIEAAAARISLIIHLVKQAAVGQDTDDSIDEYSIEAGVRIAEWYADEGLRLYGMFSESDQARQQRELIELVQRHGGTVTPRELQRSSRKFSTADQAEKALQELVDVGLGSFDVITGGTSGGRPSYRFSLTSNDKTSENVGTQEVLSTSTVSAVEKCDRENDAEEWEEFTL